MVPQPNQEPNQAPAQRGDETELYERYAARLRYTVRGRVGTSEANIEDACAFAWAQLLRHQPHRENVLGWLCTVAIREAIHLDQRAQRIAPLASGPQEEGEPEPVDPHTVEDILEVHAARETVAAARLSDRQRLVLSLFVAGYTYDQIVEVTGDSRRTVERQLMRAKRKLRAASAEQGGED